MADQIKLAFESIRDSVDFDDFKEDLLRLSSPGLARKQAAVIRKAIIDTIDTRVRNFVERALAAPAVPDVDTLTAEAIADVVTKLMRAGHIDWTSREPEYEGGDDGAFNSDAEERATLCHFIRKVAPALATPSTAPDEQKQPRPTDDELWDQTIRDRDTYHDWADKLAEAIANHFGAYIGEHSNTNCPWAEALEAIEDAAHPAGAVAVEQAKPICPWCEKATLELSWREDGTQNFQCSECLNFSHLLPLAIQPQATPLEATSEQMVNLQSKQIFEVAAPYFAWNANNWEKATKGTIGMPALLAYTKAAILADRVAQGEASEQMGGAQVATVEFNAEHMGHLINRLSVANRRDGWKGAAPEYSNADRERAVQAVEIAERNLFDYVKSLAAEGEATSERKPLPPLPELDSLDDIAHAKTADGDGEGKWDADYRSTWQKLQVAERNKSQWRAYALQLRDILTQHHGIGGGK